MRKIYEIFIISLSKFFFVFPLFLKKIIWSFTEIFGGYFFSALRVAILKSESKSIGKNVFIGKYVEIRDFDKITIGNNVSVQRNCYLDAAGGITIGDNVSIAHACSLISFDHDYTEDKPIKYNKAVYREIKIANDVWIGCGCRILSGASLGTRVIVAAGSVCTAKVPSDNNIIIAGIPAKIVKNI